MMALHELKRHPEIEIAALFTTVTLPFDRISMHGVRRALLEEQAASLGFRLEPIYLSEDATNGEYEEKLEDLFHASQPHGITTVAFGDIFLEDLRRYREAHLRKTGMEGLFPIWKRDTRSLLNAFMEAGFKAVITCVDTKVLDGSFAGRAIDQAFLRDLPQGIDPCGENGEFHSFVFDGPDFARPIEFALGRRVFRSGFCFRDLIPKSSASLTGEMVCERCAKTFTCDYEAGKESCWCERYPLASGIAPSGRCLCPDCLQELSSRSA
jgi:uncharacterized protein (TIGR00290 family)